MSARSCRAFRIAVVAFLGLTPWLLADAQDSLQSQLGEKFKLAKLGTDSTGLSIIETGTVLVIKKGGILGVPPSASILIPSYVKDGQVKTANNTAMAGVNKLMSWKHVSDPTGTASTDTKFLTVDEKVYASKIDVNVKDSKVTLTIIECDSCNQVKDASSRRAQVVFQFPSGYLVSADGGQVADVINQVLAFDTSSDTNQQAQDQQPQQQDQAAQQPAAAPAPAAPAAPAQPPPTIQLGQTTDEVTGLFGPPTKIINLGTKIIYVYKDMKVTFIKGKVTDVQ
jgi:hypothetical protein